ncbi:MAG: DNA-processing protein DprA [Lachnospiraceae bacterium]|nr:DNA-processing protein DprA [Lachnospiraceae bacterium]
MEERIYDYWVATLQDGYIGDIVNMVDTAGGARPLFEMSEKEMKERLGITERLAGYIGERKGDISLIEEKYYRLAAKKICYVNHTDADFPDKLRYIPSRPYGLFVKGSLPDLDKPSVAIVGARQCSEYGRIMAEYFGSRLAGEGVQIISGMAWGIDGISQMAAVNAGGRSFAVLGCGVDITYPVKNRILYNRLCEDGNGIVSEYAPGTPAESRRFPPRNRIISGLCDVLIVVEARARSGTLITVDMAVDQGRCVMVVPGRLTDDLSVGCLNLLYQGALLATGTESVLEQLGIGRQMNMTDYIFEETSSQDTAGIPLDIQKVAKVLTIDPSGIEEIAQRAGVSESFAAVALTKLELKNLAKEISPGFFTGSGHRFRDI